MAYDFEGWRNFSTPGFQEWGGSGMYYAPHDHQYLQFRSSLLNQINQGPPNIGGSAWSRATGAGANMAQMHQQARDAANQVGGAARERINEDAIRNLASAQQGLTSRGLGNTTVRETTRRGVERDRQLSQRGIDEQQAQLRSNLLMQQAGQQANQQQALASLDLQRQSAGYDQYLNTLNQFASLL